MRPESLRFSGRLIVDSLAAMCGRYMITSPLQAMADLFEAQLDPWLDVDGPRLNVSPTERVPVVTSSGAGRWLSPMRWGLLPPWYRSPNATPLLSNARAETLADKPAFREAARKRRCLIPADGFYEWSGPKGTMVARLIRPAAGGLIALAGVWQDWGPPDARATTCAIVTCAANAVLAPIHDRMPVVIASYDFSLWLGEAGHGAARLMAPAPNDVLTEEPVDATTLALLARRVE